MVSLFLGLLEFLGRVGTDGLDNDGDCQNTKGKKKIWVTQTVAREGLHETNGQKKA